MEESSHCDLYVLQPTLQCFLQHDCVACLYKLFPRGKESLRSALGKVYNIPHNIRPEQCHHFNVKVDSPYVALHRADKQRLLTVGDGDFSFSLSIAQGRQSSDNEDIQEVRKFYATSHESHDTVTSVYPQCSDTLNKLRKLNVKIFHDIDATNLAQSGNIPKGSFDIICWNFPCIRHEAGADGQVSELEANKDLVRRFFENVRPFLREKGMREIHVTHKTIEPFSWWGIIDIAKECDMEHLGSVVFDRCLYQGYTNRKALDKKSFPLHDARTYIFRVPGESNTKQSTFERHPHIVGLGCADTRRVLESKLKSLYGECEDTKREANDAIHSIGGKRSGDEAYSETIASNSDRKTKKKKI